MHPRNLYNKRPDFEELAEVRPSLKQFLIPRSPAKRRSTQQPSPSDTGDLYPSTSSDDLDPNNKPPLSNSSQKTENVSPSQTEPLSLSEHLDVEQEYGLTRGAEKFPYTLDFSNPEALRELTCAVLERDFGLKVELPLDRLIPAVPQRLNYVHWIEDLLMCCRQEVGGVASGDDDVIAIPKGDDIVGIDIGTGASCIYPLLGTVMNGWKFLATEIDKGAVRYARENVARNSLENKIEVKEVDPSTILIEAVDETVQYSFCMCNPPFFKDNEDRYGGGGATRSKLRPPPKTFSSGTVEEMITEGGEVEFVKRIVHDSLILRSRVRWYSSMLGKKASVKEILSELKHHKVPVTTSTEFVQGKTWRWAVAWSFDETLKDKVGNLTKPPTKRAGKHQLPLVLQLPTDAASEMADSFVKAREWLLEQLKGLKVDYTYTTSEEPGSLTTEGTPGQSSLSLDIHCIAKKNTWSHQRRRRRLMERLQAQHSSTTPDSSDASSSVTALDDSQRGQQTSLPVTLSLSQTSSNCSKAEERKAINLELESLSPPCRLEFKCSLLTRFPHEEAVVIEGKHCHVHEVGGKRKRARRTDSGKMTPAPKTKKRKTNEGGMRTEVEKGSVRDEGEGDGSVDKDGSKEAGHTQQLYLEFEWLCGDDRDMLHQVMQYFKNKCQNVKF